MEAGLGDRRGSVAVRTLSPQGDNELVPAPSSLDLLDGIALVERALDGRLDLRLDQTQDSGRSLVSEPETLHAP